METKDLDTVFAEANETRPVTAKQALGMIAKSMSRVADPETTDDDARDAMIRCYKFTEAASAALAGDAEELPIEKALADSVEADGEGVRAAPVSRAADAIRKRFDKSDDAAPAGDGNGDDAAPAGDDATGDDATGDGNDGGGEGTFDERGVAWQHDLNATPDPDDDWGSDPKF